MLIAIYQSPKWCHQNAFFVKLTVQKHKTLQLLSSMIEKSSNVHFIFLDYRFSTVGEDKQRLKSHDRFWKCTKNVKKPSLKQHRSRDKDGRFRCKSDPNQWPQKGRVSLWQAWAESFRRVCCLEEWSRGLWEPVSAQFTRSAHILLVNPCPGASWAAQSHVSSPHSSLGPLKWAHPPGALRTTKTTNTGLSRILSETHRCTLACTHAHTHQLLTAHLSLIQWRDNSRDKDIICVCC